jgi:tetratricopeptide (TPR) repeat protein
MTLLVLAVVAVVVVLPKLVDTPTGNPVSELRPESATPIPSPTVAVAATPPHAGGFRRTVDGALAEGRSALATREPGAAAVAFRRTLTLEPGNTDAAQGLRRAEKLARVLELETSAAAHEQRGDHRAAAIDARRALELDPGSSVARGVASRVARQADRDAYHELVSRGLAELESQRYQQALDTFSAAADIRPEAPEVTDGLTRARAGIHRQKVAAHLGRAADAEAAEEWALAVDEFRSTLALDATLVDARDGLDRSTLRLELARRMTYHLDNPGRLATTEVLREAADLANEARTVTPRSPRFTELINRLDRLVADVSVPVLVILESDGLTEVVVYRVGRLGVFERHTVELRPGTYTVVGKRPGYRDVRLTIEVSPGETPATVSVRCAERI